jgi:predicted methyltransferase
MKSWKLVVFALLAVAAASCAGSRETSPIAIPDTVAAAVSNPARPAKDKDVDPERKPAELIAFSGMKPGDKVVELVAGGGYFTRIFSKLVGPNGHVYELVSDEELASSAKAGDTVKQLSASADYPGISVINGSLASFKAPEPVDMVWTTQNYHDFNNRNFGPVDYAAFNKNIFNMLKPGGVFLIMDHSAAPGSGLRDTSSLHRIDPEIVKSQVLAAGFVLDGESDMFENTSDRYTLRIVDPAIRGKTEKFVFRFRKP